MQENRPIPDVNDGGKSSKHIHRTIPNSECFGIAEVLLAMQSVGICGSDIHFYTHGKIGHYVIEEPMVMGHEACGLVVAIGNGVTNVKVGK